DSQSKENDGMEPQEFRANERGGDEVLSARRSFSEDGSACGFHGCGFSGVEKEGEVKTYTSIGCIAWRVGTDKSCCWIVKLFGQRIGLSGRFDERGQAKILMCLKRQAEPSALKRLASYVAVC